MHVLYGSRGSGSAAIEAALTLLGTSRPDFRALLARIESDPRVAAVFTRHWPPAT